MKLKLKLTGIVFIAVFFILICSTVVIYLLLNKQYREATQNSFVNTANIIKDDLLRRMAKQAQDSENMVRSMKMGEQIKFIHDFSGADQFSLTKNSYHQTVAALVQTMSAGGFWQMAVYDKNGTVLAYTEIGDKNQIQAGFHYKNPGELYTVAAVSEGASINAIEFQTEAEMPLKRIVTLFPGDLPPTKLSFFNVIDDIFCLESQIPVFANVYNQAAQKTESALVGLVVARTRLTVAFAQHIAGLTKMEVNLFLASGQLPTGRSQRSEKSQTSSDVSAPLSPPLPRRWKSNPVLRLKLRVMYRRLRQV